MTRPTPSRHRPTRHRPAAVASEVTPSPAALSLAATLALAVLLLVAGWGCGSRNGAERQPVFRQVTPPVAFEMIRDYPGLPILDVRPRHDFHGPLGHLRSAMSAPAADLPHLLRELAWLHEETFLVYCHSDECDPRVLDFLHAEGFADAMLIHGGIEAWVADGFGTVGAGDPPDHDHAVEDLSRPRAVEEEDSDIF